jgi:phosphate-selective porin OprO/OprP
MRIGNIKPANGLEHANSSRFLDFIERSLMQDAFTGRFNNGFQPGLLFNNWNADQTATYQSSITMNTYNVFAYDAGGPDWANRITWTPINDKESHSRYLLHLGLSATERRPTDGQERIRARPSLRNGISQSWSNVVDTTIFYCDNEFLVIPEIAAVYGPWHFQAEYFGQWNSGIRAQQVGAVVPAPGGNQGTGYFNGYYAQVSYFLTGEHREYEGKTGNFGRVVPYENFYLIRRNGCPPLRTLGAWQVLYRYEVLDLNTPALAGVNAAGGGAAGVGGGTCAGHTFGINHFLNPNMKMQYNIWAADRSVSAASAVGPAQVGGGTVGFGARLAFDF